MRKATYVFILLLISGGIASAFSGSPYSVDISGPDFVNGYNNAFSRMSSIFYDHKNNNANPHNVTAAQVGLGNVTNDAQVKRSEMGVANGVATTDGSNHLAQKVVWSNITGTPPITNSFNGRSGTVMPQSGDYTAAQVGALPLSGGTITGAIRGGQSATFGNMSGTYYGDGSHLLNLPASGGGKVLLNTLTASNSANLQDTTSFTSSYRYYEILLENLVPATSNVNVSIAVYVSGAWKVASYQYAAVSSDVGSTTNFHSTSAASISLLNGANLQNTTSGGLCGNLLLYNPADTTHYKIINWAVGASDMFAGANPARYSGTGAFMGGVGAVTGIQVFMSSGNIASGAVKIYGWN